MSSLIQLPVTSINRHRLQTDGEGVTTLIGSYGCPLQCSYCLNPRTWAADTKYRYYTPSELFDAVKIDDLYFQATGGGIVFGGGEPLLHSAFIKEFKSVCPPDWKIYAESSLNVPTENVKQVIPVIDHYIIDIKDMNPEIYQAYTGMENGRVLQNLELLLEKIGPDRLVVRVPRIPSFNTQADMEKSTRKLLDMGITNLDIFSYIIRG